MNLDKQRIAAVKTLEALGYAWEPAVGWKPPLVAKATASLSERDFAMLHDTICRHLMNSSGIAPIMAEIKGWGWFR
jgi:hypothetical protein